MDITATLGPASLTPDTIKELSKKVSRFRLNSGHISPSELRTILKMLGNVFPVVVDLQGAKVRIGEFVEVKELPQELTIVRENLSNDVKIIPLPDEQFFKALKIKERLYLNDAKIELEVINTSSKKIEAVVIKNGPISSFKSINRKDHPIHFVKITDADKRMIGASIKHENIQYAVSFIHNGEEAKLYRPLVKHKKLIAKIERPECMAHLINIHRNFDELWFCRGDMGSLSGLSELQNIQNEFIANFNNFTKPKFIAGRLLWNMIDHTEPTKEELEHLYSVNKAGFDGLVLSDETAVGKHPLKVVEFLSSIF